MRPGRLVLLGHPVAHSLSPRMHGAALRAAGIDLEYTALDVAPVDLPRAMRRLTHERAAGSVTIPHKEAMLALCDDLAPLARHVGAVNTFWTRDRALVGDNTDVDGFDAAARTLLEREPRELSVGILGAGGAAAAVLAAVGDWPGCTVRVHNRTLARAARLCERLGGGSRAVASVLEAVRDADLIVNATSVGLQGDDMPVEPSLLPPSAVVLDLVYRPGETALVRAARARGIRASDGRTMLVEQGAAAFRRWFGVAPDREAMWTAFQ